MISMSAGEQPFVISQTALIYSTISPVMCGSLSFFPSFLPYFTCSLPFPFFVYCVFPSFLSSFPPSLLTLFLPPSLPSSFLPSTSFPSFFFFLFLFLSLFPFLPPFLPPSRPSYPLPSFLPSDLPSFQTVRSEINPSVIICRCQH